MKKVWCDRCNAELGEEDVDTFGVFEKIDIFTGLPSYHLCNSCKEGLAKAIKTYVEENKKPKKKGWFK